MKNELDVYFTKSIFDLQRITPKWACGKNLNKAFIYFREQLSEEYLVFFVNPSDLISKANLEEVDCESLFTHLESSNNTRIARILQRWDNDRFVDPPTIYISNRLDNTIAFSDGRHRAKIAHILGYQQIPVPIHNDDIEKIRSLIEVIPF